MSECQYVAFRAIDAPVSEPNLDFMRRQSSRARITAWSFDNEYHFGDFHGNAIEMLRHGYDFHLHFADFGIRKLMIRLPSGLPDAKAADPYIDNDAVEFVKDKKGNGGILQIEPFHEPGDLDDLSEVGEIIDRLLPLRAEIQDGDLRPLYLAYLAYLAVGSDGNHNADKTKDAPVPAGLDKLTDAQQALAELYNLSGALVAAAARDCPPMPQRTDAGTHYAAWLQQQPDAIKNAWLCQLMTGHNAPVRSEILAEYHKSHVAPSWPIVHVDRTIAELMTAAKTIEDEQTRARAETAARQRARRLADMKSNPMQTLREAEELVEQRSIHAYGQMASLLADLREALSGTDKAGLADHRARMLKDENPKLHYLAAALRRQGFLKKSPG